MKKIAVLLSLCLNALCVCGLNAAAFRNLDFESAFSGQTAPVYSSMGVAATDALPGWILNGREEGNAKVTYNTYLLDGTDISLFSASQAISGNYSVVIENGHDWMAASQLHEVSISQTGYVSTAYKSLSMLCDLNAVNYQAADISEIYITLGGVNIPLTILESYSGDLVKVGGNIPASLRGQTLELKIGVSTDKIYAGLDYRNVAFDSISFSYSSVVPEPTSWCLLFGVCAVGGMIRKSRGARGS